MNTNPTTDFDTTADEVKGRAKEATGALTGDDELKKEGVADQRAAGAKAKIDEIAGKVKDGIDEVKSRLTRN